jgi:uncharacterized protein YbjT (DUF2867 family)
MTTPKSILVTGATGKQGGAVIQSLLAANDITPTFEILALTRTLSSQSAQKLAVKPNVTVIEGDLNNVPAIFAKLPSPLHGVFSVQTAGNSAAEEKQGKDLIDAAVRSGVKHFVYSSVDRGGPQDSDQNATPIAHFITKFNIEKHLLATAGDMQYTIIRPVGFMDNFTPDFYGAAMSSMLKLNGEESRFQLVCTKNIGDVAGLAFQRQEEFAGRCISLAGDDLSWKDMDEIFKRVTGAGAPTTYGIVGSALRWMLSVQMDWFRDLGFGADVEECKMLLPGLLGFEQWLREESGFSKIKSGR